MTKLIVDIYDYLRLHRAGRWMALLVTTVLLVALVMRQTYKEDISDFLPLNDHYEHAMEVYQDLSGADRIVAVFEHRDTTQADPDTMVMAIETFALCLQQADTASLVTDLVTQVDTEQFEQVTRFVYANIPYFLTPADYDRIDSLLDDPHYVDRQLEADKQMLMFPVSGLLSQNFGRDPLNLFTPVVTRMQQSAQGMNYELYDGYIFSPDMTRAIAVMTSPYGSSETDHNAALLQMLQRVAGQAMTQHPAIDIRLVGGPVIAVGNANQIKTDSLISVMLAVLLIVGLLYWVFRNVRNLLLIIVSIAWGWLFAMALLAAVHDQVSVIVIGISSVILGIAVNYPLHLIAHLRHTPDMRMTLKQVVMPLVVGNITTVGAFMALVPLQSVALRDLGLFSAFLLMGTILFVMVFLPHLAKAPRLAARSTILDRMGEFTLENRRWLVAVVAALTIVFAYLSLNTSFDANISHINYMTDEQRNDMAYFQSLTAQPDAGQSVFVVSTDTTLDGALARSERLRPCLDRLHAQGLVTHVDSPGNLLCSSAEQQRRLQRWNQLLEQHGEHIEHEVARAAAQQGFASGSFDEFYQLLHQPFAPQSAGYFAPLTTTVGASLLKVDSVHHRYQVIHVLSTPDSLIRSVELLVDKYAPEALTFDVASMNSTIATHLSDDFNYIGWACASIVFLFLWFSLGSLELALLSFLPMAVSWVWILGIMALLGIQFNVVNVILATFIFGQGDDYTIFMTEGCQYEYAYGRKMLASYKNSIIISALIMFIGIGALIFAKHPALHSLAQVTVVGMFSVVLMAYLFPPLIFKWLIARRGVLRERPLTLRSLVGMRRDDLNTWVEDWYRYRGVEISTAVRRRLKRNNYYAAQLAQVAGNSDLSTVVVHGAGWGELPVMLAKRYPNLDIIAIESEADCRAVIEQCAAPLTTRLRVLQSVEGIAGLNELTTCHFNNNERED